jgi:hypothetical protein
MEMVRRGLGFLRASIARQHRSLAVAAPVAYALTAIVLLAASLQRVAPAAFLVRDPSQVAKYPFYIGLISHLGVLLWCAGAAICLFSAGLARERVMRRFLLASGLVTAVLGLDDLLTLHESAFPDYLGVPEHAVLAAEGLIVAAFLLGFVRVIVRTDFLLLGLAFAFFAGSELVDQGAFNQGLNYLLDDGLKLFGIVSWLLYLVRTSAQAVGRQATPQPRPEPVLVGAADD